MLVDSLLCVRCPQTPWIGMTYCGGRREEFIFQHLSISYYSLCKGYPLGMNLTALPGHIPESPKGRGQEVDNEETGEVCSSFEKSEKDPKWKRNIFGQSRDSPKSVCWSPIPKTPACVFAAAATAKSLQRCPTLCDPIDGRPPGFPIPGILQARTLEWVAISFSNASKWKGKVKSLSHVRLFATPWTAAYQAPLSMGFSRQENWSGVPLPSLVFGASLAVKQVRCSHQGRLSNKTVVLIRGDQDTDGPRGKVMWRSGEKTALWKPNREGPEDARPANHLEFGLQKLWEYKLLLFKPLSLWHFIMAALGG